MVTGQESQGEVREFKFGEESQGKSQEKRDKDAKKSENLKLIKFSVVELVFVVGDYIV